MKSFTALHINNLGIDNLYGLIKTTVEISTEIKDSIGDIASLALSQLETINTELEKRMKKTLGSVLTPELRAIDSKRNNLFAEIKRFVTTADKSSSTTLKAAGSSFKKFLEPYWRTENAHLNTITSIYEEMFDRYRADKSLQSAATTIGIAALIVEMEKYNTDYDRIYKVRNAETGSKTGNSASEIKKDAIKAYDQYCTAIEQVVNLKADDKINGLFVEMDNLRRKYAVIKPKKRETTKEIPQEIVQEQQV